MGEVQTQNETPVQNNKKVNLRKTTILIVDPNEFARTFIRSICRNLHFGNILTASTTTEAFELLKANPVQLIVCDWALEPLSSIDFSKQLRQMKDNQNCMVPIIILTSSGSPEAIVSARDAGVDDYLTRPIVMKRLLNSFVSVLCMPRTFVRSKTYVGPCRRRKRMAFNGPERRAGWPPKPGQAAAAVPTPMTQPKQDEKITVVTTATIDAKTTESDEADSCGSSMEEMEKAGEAAIQEESANYSKVRLDDIAEIFELVRAMKEPHTPMKDTLNRLYTKALDVKGMGKTFGFPLLTKVGDLLCNFIWGADSESFRALTKLQVVETHAIIMKMILDQNMRDETDELAKEMMEELEVMVKKFKSPG